MRNLAVLLVCIFSVPSVLAETNTPCLLSASGTYGTCLQSRLCMQSLPANHGQSGATGCADSEICCPPDNSFKPVLYSDVAFRASPSINANAATKDVNFTHIVLLAYLSNYGRSWKCTGALLNENTVLTSASCLNIPLFEGPVAVKACTQLITVASVKVNPKYDAQSGAFNTANIILARNVEFGPKVGKACIGESASLPDSIITAGWGTLSFENLLHGTLARRFMSETLPITEQSALNFSVTDRGSLCLADRGGMAHIESNSNCKYAIVGVLSDWKDCGREGSKGYFTKVSNSDAFIP